MSERLDDELKRLEQNNEIQRETFAHASPEVQQLMLNKKAWEIAQADQVMSINVAGWGGPPMSYEAGLVEAQRFYSPPAPEPTGQPPALSQRR